MPPKSRKQKETDERNIVHLDGTTLEGGGQLLRIAVGLSALTRIPVHISNIRGNRSGGGGLKAQHLTSVMWLAKACGAQISGAGLKSKELLFRPSPIHTADAADSEWIDNGEIIIKQSTPGSINLVFQAILPYIIFSGASNGPVKLRITGGTNVSNSPSYDYVEQVLIPMLANIGIRINPKLQSRGWSQGGTKLGAVTYTITPLPATQPHIWHSDPFTSRGDSVNNVHATILAPKDYEYAFQEELYKQIDANCGSIFGTWAHDPAAMSWKSEDRLTISFEDSGHDKRFYILLVATAENGFQHNRTSKPIKLGRDYLYDKAVRPGRTEHIPREMVKKVVKDLVTEIRHEGCVDEYLRDQLIVFQALAKDKMTVDPGSPVGRNSEELLEMSLHAKTAVWVVGEMLGVHFDEYGNCEGVGFVPGAWSGGSTATEEGAQKRGQAEELAEGLHRLEV